MEIAKEITRYAIAVLFGSIIGFIWCFQWNSICQTANESGTELHMWKKGHFLLTEDNLESELRAQGCENIEKAMEDAMAGSDSLRSFSCTEYGNIFGLLNKDGEYKVYRHWTESISDYLCQNQYLKQ